MKSGKYIPLGIYQNVKIGFGTIDHKNLKTIYIKLNSWVLPEVTDGYDGIISSTRQSIKKYIYNLNNILFQKESIVDLDIRTKGIKLEKKSFMDLEITLFVKNYFDIKEIMIKNMMKKFAQDIITENLIDKNLFNFHKNKK